MQRIPLIIRAAGPRFILLAALALSACADMDVARQQYQGGNLTAARANYKQMAEAGYPEAQGEYGLMLVRGEGGAADITQGERMLKSAGDHDIPKALVARGKLYQDGTGVPKNPDLAETLYKRAIALGYAHATYPLATLYDDKDAYAQAEALYKESLKDDNFRAAQKIGDLYAKGRGHTVDYTTALAWYYYAQAHHVDGMEQRIAKLEPKAGADGIARAKELASSWH